MKKTRLILTVCIVLVLLLALIGYLYTSSKPASNNKTQTVDQKKIILQEQKKDQLRSIKKSDIVSNPYHPVVIAWKDENDVFSTANLLGGSKDGKWFNIEDFDINFKGKLMKPDEYREVMHTISKEEDLGKTDLIKVNDVINFYSDNKLIAPSKIKDTGIYTQWSTDDFMVGAHIEPFKSNQSFLVGVNGEWNALPRLMKELPDGNSYLVDIEGDGKEEMIKIEDVDSTEDDVFKEISLIKGDKTMLITEERHTTEYEPKEEVNKFKWIELMTLDLNGDGKLEIVVKTSLGYGVALTVYEINESKAEPVLEFYDGD